MAQLKKDDKEKGIDRLIRVYEEKFIAEARQLFETVANIERETEIFTRLRVLGESIRFAKSCKFYDEQYREG